MQGSVEASTARIEQAFRPLLATLARSDKNLCNCAVTAITLLASCTQPTAITRTGGGGGGGVRSTSLQDFEFTIVPATVGLKESVDLSISISPSDGVTFAAGGNDKVDVTANAKATVTGKALGDTSITVTASKAGYNSKQFTANIAVVPAAGSIIMKDGTFKRVGEITASNKDDAIAGVPTPRSSRGVVFVC